MPVFERPELQLYYEIEGDGPPLVLFPGLASDSASWLPVVQGLAERFTLIRPDPRASGRTQPRDAAISIPTLAADILALLDHLGLEDTHLLGHSMGGVAALYLAHERPERIRRLVLAASVPAHIPRNVALIDAIIDLREAGLRRDLWLRHFLPWLFHPRFFQTPAQVEATILAALSYRFAQPPEALRRQIRAFDAYDPAPLRGPPPVPTLALLAAEDLLIPYHIAQPTLAQMPGVETQTLAEAGHSLHWDAPEPFVQTVTGFLTAP